MRPTIFTIFCLAVGGNGRRLQKSEGAPFKQRQELHRGRTTPQPKDEIKYVQSEEQAVVTKPLNALAMLCLSLHLSSGWRVSFHSKPSQRWAALGLKRATSLSARTTVPQAKLELEEDDVVPFLKFEASDEEANEPLLVAALKAASALSSGPVAQRDTTVTPLAASWTDGNEEFDLEAYERMADDDTRTSWFREAIHRRLEGTTDRVVVDIGTGPFCILAFHAARAGARRVFAVEADPLVAEMARQTLADAEAADEVPAGIVEIIEGFSTNVSLPEPADLLVAEIVGEIATAEAIVHTMCDAQARHLRRPYDPDSYIPQRVQTWCSPVSYMAPFLLRPEYCDYDFLDDVAEKPISVSCINEGVHLLSEPQLLEDLELFRPLAPLQRRNTSTLSFVVDSECLEEAEEAYGDVLGELLTVFGCSVKSVDALMHNLARSLAGLACWPRLVLDGSSSNGTARDAAAPALVVESRGAYAYVAEDAADADDDYVAEMLRQRSGDTDDFADEEEAAESCWGMTVPLLSPRPLPIDTGDVVNLTYTVEYSTGVNVPTRFEFQGQLIPATD